MIGVDIINVIEVQQWVNIDYDENVLTDLINVAFDVISDSINSFTDKIKSAKFIRKLKLCMLNCILEMYNDRGMVQEKVDKIKYVNQSILFQLQYCTYLESDL
ncbi:head-tail connector protein [Clostridium tagluense]|uniref:head-tail connector protein n=1 Tax=Clostridium tagluense TaxID=360422 RepID=UPI001C6E6D38|nr:head-tail connector protein [Clostridium tagluense]MBW9154865.1 head-tail connector protein [Clostridium tagluense]WLC64320.1 head-tail connector protein [Clostridium tagluense]